MIYEKIKVLLVEDVLTIAKVTEQMLRSSVNPYTSTHKMTLADALAALEQDHYDMILLDLNLPDSGGLDTVARVVEAAADVPIMVLTASNEASIGIRSVQMGAQDFLVKGEFNHTALDRAIMFSMERHRMQRTLRQLAVLDELTGLYNRRGFKTLHGDVLQRVGTSELRGFLCFFDLDHFKQINDELGHAKGDEALKEFAALLRVSFRKDTLLVRLGGDEFVAMGIEQQPAQAEQALETLRSRLEERKPREPGSITLASSWGLVYFDKNGPLDIETLSAAADAALYQNKENRRRLTEAMGLHPR